MGNNFIRNSDTKPFQYAEFTSLEKQPNQTRILRKPEMVNATALTKDPLNLGTLINAFDNAKRRFPNKHFLGTRKHIKGDEYGEYEWKTYSDVDELSNLFLCGIHSLKLCPQIIDSNGDTFKFLGIYSKNREEWINAYLACCKNSITVVTVYDTLGLHAVEFIFKQTEMQTILMESVSLNKILELKKQNKIGKLRNLIILPCDNDTNMKENVNKCIEEGLTVFYYDDILKEGKTFLSKNSLDSAGFVRSTPETILTFCYTSGTTGDPKGAMISNQSLLASVCAMQAIGIDLNETDIYLSFLPLAHIMEQLVLTAMIYAYCAIGFFSGHATRIVSDAQALKPTVFIGVPRILTRVYDSIMKKINMQSTTKRRIAHKAIETKIYNYERYGILNHVVYDKLVFNKIKSVLGSKVRWILVGSAPMPGNILQTLRVIFGCPITEGYGQTENCAGCLLANITDSTYGHLGGPSTACEIKLVDVPELQYTSEDVNPITGVSEPRGEICCRGSILFSGYYKDKEKTKEAIDEDGWLHSGDIGMILTTHGNAIRIIDRKKNIFKLSQGEYLAPEKIQNIITRSKYIAQLFIYGDSLSSYIVSIIVPERDECVSYLKSKGVDDVTMDNVTKYYESNELKEEIMRDIREIGKQYDLKGFEIPRAIHLSPEPFTVENDILSPTLKIKANVAKKIYAKEIAKMYQVQV